MELIKTSVFSADPLEVHFEERKALTTLSLISRICSRVYGSVREEFERGTLSNYQGGSLDNKKRAKKKKKQRKRHGYAVLEFFVCTTPVVCLYHYNGVFVLFLMVHLKYGIFVPY